MNNSTQVPESTLSSQDVMPGPAPNGGVEVIQPDVSKIPTQTPTQTPTAEPQGTAGPGSTEAAAITLITEMPAPTGGKTGGETKADFPGGLIFGICLAAVIALAAAAAAYMAVKRQKPAPTPDNGPKDETGFQKTEVVENPESVSATCYAAGYAQTVGSRGNQEDSCFVSDWSNPDTVNLRGVLAVVADGVGGISNGQVASNAAVQSMKAYFESQGGGGSMSGRLLSLAAQAQKDVLGVIRQVGRCATTLVTVLIQDRQMVMLSVGDSRIALYRAGALLQLNREHVVGKEIDENAALHAEAVADGRKRQAITSYLGKDDLRLIDRTTTPLQLIPGDRVLLMSDGVFNAMSDDELIAFMNRPPKQAAEAVIRAIEEKKLSGQDNATIVIVEVR
ncbi:MAG: serine/threonine-protein phosphatase [Clostridia bacterium]|nr:serine/threonine-protein phosphatase [Clostridia bacterium]